MYKLYGTRSKRPIISRFIIFFLFIYPFSSPSAFPIILYTVTPLSSMENISSGRNIASGHNLQIVLWRNIASQQSLLPVKIFCPDIIFRFFYISSRRNIVLGDNLPWTNMDWLYMPSPMGSVSSVRYNPLTRDIISPYLRANPLRRKEKPVQSFSAASNSIFQVLSWIWEKTLLILGPV